MKKSRNTVNRISNEETMAANIGLNLILIRKSTRGLIQ